MMIKAPPDFLKKLSATHIFLFADTRFWHYDSGNLKKITWFFSEVGAFVFGSRLAIIPFLCPGVVKEYGWLTENNF